MPARGRFLSLNIRVFCCSILGLLAVAVPGRAEYAFDAQDLLNAGRRATTISEFARNVWSDFNDQVPHAPRWSFLLRGLQRNYSGFPVVSEFGIMKSDLKLTQAAFLAGYSLADAGRGRSLDFSLGFYGMHYGVVTPVSMELPPGDPYGENLEVSDFIGQQLYDDLINLRVSLGGLFSLRAGWMRNAVYQAAADGQLERSEDSLLSKKIKWVYELELLSSVKGSFRLDDTHHVEYWEISWTGFAPLVSWILSGREKRYLDFVGSIKHNADGYRSSAAARGRMELLVKAYSENYYRSLLPVQRGGSGSNLVYELSARKKIALDPAFLLSLQGTAGVFSRSYARWHQDRFFRELSFGVGFEHVVVLDPDRLTVPRNPLRDLLAWGMRFSVGQFTDAGLGYFDNSGDLSVTGYRFGVWLSVLNSLRVDFELSCNDPQELKKFVEAKDRFVWQLEFEIKTGWKWWRLVKGG